MHSGCFRTTLHWCFWFLFFLFNSCSEKSAVHTLSETLFFPFISNMKAHFRPHWDKAGALSKHTAKAYSFLCHASATTHPISFLTSPFQKGFLIPLNRNVFSAVKQERPNKQQCDMCRRWVSLAHWTALSCSWNAASAVKKIPNIKRLSIIRSYHSLNHQ